MSPCKAILHTPHMMYGGREDMCPHLHTITLYYLISFHLAILSQEGGHIACSPNNISTFFFIFVSTSWRQYVKRREEAINAWWGLGPWSLVHLGPRTLVLEPYKQIFPKLVLTLSNRLNSRHNWIICILHWIYSMSMIQQRRGNKNKIKCKLVISRSLGHKLD